MRYYPSTPRSFLSRPIWLTWMWSTVICTSLYFLMSLFNGTFAWAEWSSPDRVVFVMITTLAWLASVLAPILRAIDTYLGAAD